MTDEGAATKELVDDLLKRLRVVARSPGETISIDPEEATALVDRLTGRDQT